MKRWKWILPLICLALVAETAGASVVHRFVLATGANDGGEDRIPLQYAVSDAERFAEVMVLMGGVEPGNRVLLAEPSLSELERSLDDLRERVMAVQAVAGRTELLFYYSGHADERGLLLGAERLGYESLRRMLDAIPAKVRISVLDACASGAITRSKGGERRPAFLVDESSSMEGYAFLTSSSANESAQESDRIGASFFTHYLISGMQGAADVSGEGRVTLGEAYQFAFNETLASTARTQGGAQHPAYDINLSGTGDVVMTDVRETSAGLLLGEELSGRLYVQDADERLVVELFKPAGRTVELGLEPGTYAIHLQQERTLFLATPELASGDRLLLDEADFQPTAREPTMLRGAPIGSGGTERGRQLRRLNRRSAIGIAVGWNSVGPKDRDDAGGVVVTKAGGWGPMPVLSYSYWLRDDLAVGLSLSVRDSGFSSDIGTEVTNEALDLVSLLFDVRRTLSGVSARPGLRTYISAGLGTWIASVSRVTTGTGVLTETTTLGAPGIQLGGGMEVALGKRFMIGARAGFNLVADFKEEFGGKKNYSGFESSVGVQFLFGG